MHDDRALPVGFMKESRFCWISLRGSMPTLKGFASLLLKLCDVLLVKACAAKTPIPLVDLHYWPQEHPSYQAQEQSLQLLERYSQPLVDH